MKKKSKTTPTAYKNKSISELTRKVEELTKCNQYLKEDVVGLENEVVRLSQKLEASPPGTITFEDCVPDERFVFRMGKRVIGRPGQQPVIYFGQDDYLSVPSEQRAKQLAAIAKMMTVADALNDKDFTQSSIIAYEGEPFTGDSTNDCLEIRFSSVTVAKKAIRILGEDTIKTAFGI